MARIVGMSRNLKLQWLNKVVQLIRENYTETEIKEQLNEYLSFEIKSPTNLRKTREILMNIWVYDNNLNRQVKQQALQIISKQKECTLEVHWCMILIAYPVFMDMCRMIGKFSEFQDVITLSQLKQKLYDEWGERTTLHHSIEKLIATLKDFTVLLSNKPGKYMIAKIKINNTEMITLMLMTLMLIEGKGYYSLSEINASAYLFPFEYKVDKELILENENFITNNFGGEFVVMLKDLN